MIEKSTRRNPSLFENLEQIFANSQQQKIPQSGISGKARCKGSSPAQKTVENPVLSRVGRRIPEEMTWIISIWLHREDCT